jgi:hypothetical protein
MGIFSSIFGAKALKKANSKARAETREGMTESLGYFEPYDAQGRNALAAYGDGIGIGDSSAAIERFKNSPLYRLQFDEAMKAGRDDVIGSGTAGGLRNSGATLAALQDRAQRITNNTYQQYLNPLAGLTEMGVGIAGNKANIRTGGANALADLRLQKGQIKAGQMAGFDSLLNAGLRIAGGFM